MTIRITGMNSGLDTEAIIDELVKAKSEKKTKFEKAQTKLGWKQEAWKGLNTKIYSFYTSTLSDLRFTTAFQKKASTCSQSSAATITASDSAPLSTQTMQIDKLAKSGYMTGGEIKTADGGKVKGSTTMSELGITGDTSFSVTVGGKETEISVKADTKISDAVAQLNKAGVNASFDAKNQRMYVNSTETGEAKNFTFSGDTAALGALGLTEDAGAHKIEGRNAEIILNGVKYVSSNNVFEINGLTITAQEETKGEVTVTTANDNSGIYDMIKNFIKNYNGLVNEMDKLYNAESSKGYEPLTDEERETMSESEIEKWEKKIKDSLLKGDSTLSSVSGAMKEIMAAGVKMSDGTTMYLHDFGIETLGYFNAADNEKNAYHINGDKDDNETSGKEDVLSAMIAKDPEQVTEFFTSLAKNLYSTLTDKMERVAGYRSAYTVYNDLQLQEEYDDYTSKIKEQQELVDDYTDKYYKQFSRMETALAQLQSKSNAVSQLLGM